MSDVWKPQQYNKFKNQRAQPFWDLLDLTQNQDVRSVIDLGCGTGELTKEITTRFPHAEVLGIDSSAAMLNAAKDFIADRLKFQQQDLNSFEPHKKYDLVFSNATLQWLPQHEELFPRVLSWVSEHGQVAIQMPYNFDHPSHQIADQVAQHLPAFHGNPPPLRVLLPMEIYVQMLSQAGFENIKCRIEAYLHPMDSGRDVIEWTKGTLLTSYEKALPPEDFKIFMKNYEARLIEEIGAGPYLYVFKRILMWGKRP